MLCLVVSSPCFCDQEKPVILYIEEAGLSFKALVDKISVHTGYRINLVGEWPDVTVNTQLKGVALEDGLKNIIKELGNVSHVLIFDAEEKKVKIVRLHEGAVPDLVPVVLPEDEIISSPSPSGDPGLTHSQIASIKEEYQEKLRNQTGDTEILPATEYGPALTLAEFESIKSKYNLTLENEGENAYILPPSPEGKGITKADVNAIRKAYDQQKEDESPATVISPGSGDKPGITLGELEAIKQDHKTRQVSRDTLVSPPSSQGPGLTLGELEAIKEEYRKKHNLGDKEN